MEIELQHFIPKYQINALMLFYLKQIRDMSVEGILLFLGEIQIITKGMN